MSTTEVKDNIIIKKVDNKNMTLNVNGEDRTIHNQLPELKELLKSLKVSNVTYEKKVYNIGHINEANFGVVTSNKVFNGVLTKELILLLKGEKEPEKFLNKLRPENKENWEGVRQLLNEAQGILADTFVWVIGWELRRLFAIGNEKESNDIKVDKYINRCFSTCRISLQLINYLFISVLWDEKRKNPNIDTKRIQLEDFFKSERTLNLAELLDLFQVLIEIFKSNKLEYPIEKADLGDINEFLDSDSKFNKACTDLENLEAMDIGTEPYGLAHCHTAEISLTTILTGFRFFTNYQLVSIKKMEYEKPRYSTAMYIKDLNILENREDKYFKRRLKYDEASNLTLKESGRTYSVFFQNKNKAVNLFPFLLDFNALIDAAGFQLYFYQRLDRNIGLRYFSI